MVAKGGGGGGGGGLELFIILKDRLTVRLQGWSFWTVILERHQIHSLIDTRTTLVVEDSFVEPNQWLHLAAIGWDWMCCQRQNYNKKTATF